ncbi:hypothetical protein [Methylocaldum sp.]|uniref:hypothetical protein n=1 Tax=Methylocaldum sp. TaxID=1969727 RepID=UPI002D24A22B|nr:hypothetical protein [Methylocaldum sp.]HYE34576.1 hypothetical protein [Methylocaldum sp.]
MNREADIVEGTGRCVQPDLRQIEASVRAVAVKSIPGSGYETLLEKSVNLKGLCPVAEIPRGMRAKGTNHQEQKN